MPELFNGALGKSKSAPTFEQILAWRTRYQNESANVRRGIIQCWAAGLFIDGLVVGAGILAAEIAAQMNQIPRSETYQMGIAVGLILCFLMLIAALFTKPQGRT